MQSLITHGAWKTIWEVRDWTLMATCKANTYLLCDCSSPCDYIFTKQIFRNIAYWRNLGSFLRSICLTFFLFTYISSMSCHKTILLDKKLKAIVYITSFSKNYVYQYTSEVGRYIPPLWRWNFFMNYLKWIFPHIFVYSASFCLVITYLYHWWLTDV